MPSLRPFIFVTGSVTMLLLAGCSSSSSTSSTPTASTPLLIATSTALSASANPINPGTAVTLTGQVSGGTFSTADTVTFYDGTVSLGIVNVGPTGLATLSVSSFAAGSSHTLKATFSGDSTYAASTSSSFVIMVNSVAIPSTINAHATFTLSTANQTIAGFGLAEAFYTNYLTDHPYSSEIYKALFDPSAGLGLTFLRIQNNYAGTTTGFDTYTPKIVTSANSMHGSALTLLMSSWTPPATLKSNGSVNGCTGTINGVCTSGIGTLAQVNGAYNYADYAAYWYNSLAAYAALGVIPAYVSIQNEPDFAPTYVGARFNPTEATYQGTNYAGYNLAFDAVYNKLQTMTTPPKMVGPETFSVINFLDYASQIPAAEVSAYAHHGYNVSSGTVSGTGAIVSTSSPDSGVTALTKLNAAYPTATKFMTEYYDTPGFYNAWTIHDSLVYGNDNAYIFWQGLWPSTLTPDSTPSNPAIRQGADQAGLLYSDNPYSPSTWVFSHGWTYNDSYYALKHFSYFVRPGYVRYNAAVDNTDERVSVYQSADKKTSVIVALNVSSTATDGLALDLSGFTYTASTVYRSSFTQPVTGERFANLGSYVTPAGNGTNNLSGGITLPPQSVVTIVLTY